MIYLSIETKNSSFPLKENNGKCNKCVLFLSKNPQNNLALLGILGDKSEHIKLCGNTVMAIIEIKDESRATNCSGHEQKLLLLYVLEKIEDIK